MTPLDALPRASDRRIALQVTPAAERALRGGHPWVFDQAIVKQSHAGQPGDLAVIFDGKRRFLAIGLYDPDSPIRVRVLQHRQPATIDRAWFAGRLQAAAAIRQPLVAQHTTGYRLVHGENDGLPGLIAGRYADTLVVKLYTAAWLPHLRDVVAGLHTVQPFERLVLRLSRNTAASAAPYGLSDGQTLIGDDPGGPVIFQENGLFFAADVVKGHKTGFFFDQRDNRAEVRARAAGRRVLDVFAYSGGFSVYAAAGGATEVTSLDISAPALADAAANFALNRACHPGGRRFRRPPTTPRRRADVRYGDRRSARVRQERGGSHAGLSRLCASGAPRAERLAARGRRVGDGVVFQPGDASGVFRHGRAGCQRSRAHLRRRETHRARARSPHRIRGRRVLEMPVCHCHLLI
jgi:23S rRNA (cytosine1962-C5)-methyltransferase